MKSEKKHERQLEVEKNMFWFAGNVYEGRNKKANRPEIFSQLAGGFRRKSVPTRTPSCKEGRLIESKCNESVII